MERGDAVAEAGGGGASAWTGSGGQATGAEVRAQVDSATSSDSSGSGSEGKRPRAASDPDTGENLQLVQMIVSPLCYALGQKPPTKAGDVRGNLVEALQGCAEVLSLGKRQRLDARPPAKHTNGKGWASGSPAAAKALGNGDPIQAAAAEAIRKGLLNPGNPATAWSGAVNSGSQHVIVSPGNCVIITDAGGKPGPLVVLALCPSQAQQQWIIVRGVGLWGWSEADLRALNCNFVDPVGRGVNLRDLFREWEAQVPAGVKVVCMQQTPSTFNVGSVQATADMCFGPCTERPREGQDNNFAYFASFHDGKKGTVVITDVEANGHEHEICANAAAPLRASSGASQLAYDMMAAQASEPLPTPACVHVQHL